jgi:hypothetical protein
MKLAVLALAISVLEPLDAERPARSPVTLTFALYSSTPDAIDATATAKTRIDALWIGLQDARLRPATACKGADAKVVVPGPFTVELVKRQATTTETKREVGRYCMFEVQLRRTRGRATGAPSELKGASIVIEGRRNDGLPFTIRSRLDIALALRAGDLEGFAIPEGGARWIAGIDVARWLEDIDIGDATADSPRGRVVIDEKSNPELLAKFNANVEHGFALFEDRNGDRNLDAEERARPIAVRR